MKKNHWTDVSVPFRIKKDGNPHIDDMQKAWHFHYFKALSILVQKIIREKPLCTDDKRINNALEYLFVNQFDDFFPDKEELVPCCKALIANGKKDLVYKALNEHRFANEVQWDAVSDVTQLLLS